MNWFENVTMTAQRQSVYDAMEREDEGLGSCAYRTLLQLGDGDMRMRLDDAAWLASNDEGPPLVEWVGMYRLTSFGREIFDAANRGDWQTVVRCTTNPNIDGALN